MFELDISARTISPFVELVGAPRVEAVVRLAESTNALLGGRAIWNVSSTAAGGGVAEMLRALLRYIRGLGVDIRWAVLEAAPDFFTVTKRLHNALHDDPGDGGPLGPAERAVYDRVTVDNARELTRLVRPDEILICHDPQTAGLIQPLVAHGALVVWRCHIGYEHRGHHVDQGWEFLKPYLADVPVAVFSREAYAPSWLPRKRTVVLPPNIDPFSVKNEWLAAPSISAILRQAGLVEGAPDPNAAIFVRDDGSIGHVIRSADVVREGGPPREDVPLIVQVSRWDRMKDHLGVLDAFARLAPHPEAARAELVLAGPTVRGVADDPEGPEVFREVEAAWRAMPEEIRRRAYLVQLPMDDVEENAAMVNALQRHAAVIVQKSLREGFGLTVTEAMWKSRPVVASAVGGIQDQIEDGVDGLLVYEPRNADETATAIRRILRDPDLARRLGEASHQRACRDYTSIASLERWAELLRLLIGTAAAHAMPAPAVARDSQAVRP